MAHLINRLQMEVHYRDEAQAFNLRENFTVTLGEQIAEVADAVCSKYVGEEEWLQIDKLEIDLGHFTPYAFDENFAIVFKNKFEKALQQKLSGISPVEKRASLQLSKTVLLQYFLQKGILPWWADSSTIDIDEISTETLTHQPEIWNYFLYQQRFNKSLWKRIVFQLNNTTKVQIVDSVEVLKIWKVSFGIWLRESLNFIKNTRDITSTIYNEAIIDIVLRNSPAIFHNSKEANTFWQAAVENTDNLFEENKTVIKQALVEFKSLLVKLKEESDYNTDVQKVMTDAPGKQSPVTDVFAEEIYRVQTEQKEEEEEKYFVKHAGIVLLALFLKPFFNNLHLLHNSEWKDKEAQYKGIHLLKYISTGAQNVPEYNLTLEKIMCGIAIEEPIPLNIELQEVEKEEADGLLASVIEHWKALKHTSVNGLRETFLKRDGLLKKEESGWLLQVERKTVDVLIDSIPWGYSTVSFPWNPYVIFVEW